MNEREVRLHELCLHARWGRASLRCGERGRAGQERGAFRSLLRRVGA